VGALLSRAAGGGGGGGGLRHGGGSGLAPSASPRTAFFAAPAAALPPSVRHACPALPASLGPAAATGEHGARGSTAASAYSPEEAYDAEVEADPFHEARFLRPQFALLHSRAAGSLLAPLIGGGGCQVQRLRYTFPAPASQDIYEFLRRVYGPASALSAESCIICLVYVERLMEGGRVRLRCHNWRTVALCALLLASKVWDDLGSWSVEFAAAYPQFGVHAVNTLERAFVSSLAFNLYISGSVYARYYFALRSLNEQRSFRRRYMSVVHGPQAVPAATAKTVEARTKDARVSSLYSRSL